MDVQQWQGTYQEYKNELMTCTQWLIFFHCASHRLNLVINDLNTVTEVRNCIGKIKETITFYRDSALRKNIIGGSVLTKLCETQFVEKHKSVRQFNERFVTILEEIFKSNNFNSKTKQRSYELLSAITTPTFIVILSIISKYSAKFEIISTVLQGIDVDLQQATRHVQVLLSMLQKDRDDCETQFSAIFEKAVEIASKINLELTLPRRNARQTHRDNYPTNNVQDYFRQSLFIPYIQCINESIIISIKDRFSDEKLKIFALFDLHPKKIKYMNRQTFMKTLKVISQVYGSLLENFEEQALSWYELWQDKPLENDMKLIDILDYETFYPAVCMAIRIAITLPATLCSVERSFR